MIDNGLNIGFIGFGLIGGSIARALKSADSNYTITVSSRSIAPLEKAKEDGVIDIISPAVDNSFANCDFIFLCTPVVTITEYLGQLKNIIKKGCIITDVGSVKGAIHKAVKDLDMENVFIGGHPMAGSEQTGYIHSKASIMENAIYVVTPTPKTTTEQLTAFTKLIRQMKSIPVEMNCATHDHTVANISHAPHLISAALAKMVETSDDEVGNMHLLAASGFKDMTRLASSSPEMWEQICSANSDAIADTLTNYIDLLTQIRDNISNHTENYISTLFTEAGAYRDTFSK